MAESKQSTFAAFMRAQRGFVMTSVQANTALRRHGWDIAAAALLLYAAYLLAHVANHYYFYHGFGHGWMRYEEGAYFERLRLVVCAAWILAALRFYQVQVVAHRAVGCRHRVVVQSHHARHHEPTSMAAV